MRYPSNRPDHVRAVMQNSHDRYAQGVDLFPKFRLRVDPEDLPRKSRHAANLLVKAWERIDDDRAYFEDVMGAMSSIGSGLAVVKIGRNAVKMGYLAPGASEAETSVMFVGEFEEVYGDKEFVIADGRTASYVDGDLHQPESDFAIARGANLSQIMLTEEGWAKLAGQSAA